MYRKSIKKSNRQYADNLSGTNEASKGHKHQAWLFFWKLIRWGCLIQRFLSYTSISCLDVINPIASTQHRAPTQHCIAPTQHSPFTRPLCPTRPFPTGAEKRSGGKWGKGERRGHVSQREKGGVSLGERRWTALQWFSVSYPRPASTFVDLQKARIHVFLHIGFKNLVDLLKQNIGFRRVFFF